MAETPSDAQASNSDAGYAHRSADANAPKNEVIWRRITLAHFGAVVSAVGLILAVAGLIYTKRSYDFSVAKDQRELNDKQPAIDIQLHPAGISNLSVTISIINRSDIDISPLNIVAENSVEAGTLYFSNDRQSVEKLSSSLSLSSMGLIVPKGRSATKATLSGVTDGKFEQFHPGLALEFTVRIRYGDQRDAIDEIPIVRRILPPLAESPQPTQDILIASVIKAKTARRNQQVYFYTLVALAIAASLSLIFYLFRFWKTGGGKSR